MTEIRFPEPPDGHCWRIAADGTSPDSAVLELLGPVDARGRRPVVEWSVLVLSLVAKGKPLQKEVNDTADYVLRKVKGRSRVSELAQALNGITSCGGAR